MDRKTFPGLSSMTVSEVRVWAKMLKTEGYTPEEALDYIQGIDCCLNVQANMSIINRFAGKKKHNKANAREILAETALRIPTPERFLNNNEE